MKNLTIHLPLSCKEFSITSEVTVKCLGTEDSAKELQNALSQELPSGMYEQLEHEIMSKYLERTFNINQLESLKEVIEKDANFFVKGMYFHRSIREAIRRIMNT